MPLGFPVDSDRLAEICQRYQVTKLELFGSRARGDSHADSDVDVLVTFAPGVDLGLTYFALPVELEDLLGCSVDMVERRVVERDRNPYFREEVLRNTELLYAA